MKKKVAQYIQQMGGTSNYAGNTLHDHITKKGTEVVSKLVGASKTMYIKSLTPAISAEDIENAVIEKFGYKLPFKLQLNTN